MAMTTIEKVRQTTNGELTSEKISDTDLNAIILQATAAINSEINVEVREENVRPIDSWRENDFSDGTSTTFYVRNGVTNYLADTTNDGEVTIADVRCYKIDNDDTRTELTVSAIDVEDGSWTLSETPGTDTQKLTVTYSYSFYNVSTPDSLVCLLATYLSAAWGYFAYEHGLGGKVRFGNLRIETPQRGMSSNQYFAHYDSLLKRVQIPANKPKTKVSKFLI